MSNIHNTAIIGKDVKLGKDVEIGAYCIVEGKVEIGDNTKLYSNVVIRTTNDKSYIKIGKNNRFFSFCVIGGEPQDNKFIGEASNVEIGDNNIIREYCTINGGSELGNAIVGNKNLTRIGNNCYLYISSHIAHDVYFEDNITITNYVGVAGHCKIGHHTIIGGLTGIHQFVNIGHNVMIGGMCAITHDVPHYALVGNEPSTIAGANIIGLKRAGFGLKDVKMISQFYKDYINTDKTKADIIAQYQHQNEKVDEIIEFIEKGGKRSN